MRRRAADRTAWLLVFVQMGDLAGYFTMIPLVLFLLFALILGLMGLATLGEIAASFVKGKPQEEKDAAIVR